MQTVALELGALERLHGEFDFRFGELAHALSASDATLRR